MFRRKQEIPIRQPRIVSQNESYAFRRSRTLTGSSADAVKTVGESRAQIKSPRIRAHELRQHRRKLSLYLLASLGVVVGGWMLIDQFTGGFGNIVVTPANPRVDTSRYEKLMNDYFASNPLERFRFVLNQPRLNSYLADKAPEVSHMELSDASVPGRSDLTVAFRQPIVVWEIARQKYYIDASGHAFQQNYYGEPTVVVRDQSGIDPSAGAIASNRFLHFLGRIVALLNESGVAQVNGVVIPPNTTRQVDLKLAGRPYVVKTLLDRDPAEQVSDIINTLKYLDSKHLKPQYVDVRVSGKAFYR